MVRDLVLERAAAERGETTRISGVEELNGGPAKRARRTKEQIAADKNATGVKMIIGDFWATGMDEAKIEAQGIAPIQPQLAAIDGLNDTAAIAGLTALHTAHPGLHPTEAPA